MILKLQIYSLIFSFVFGIVFFFVLELFRDFIYKKKYLVRIINSIIISLVNALIYFGILRKINYGIIHYYFFLMILLGYCLTKYIYAKVFVKRKWMCYNYGE